MGIQEVLNRIQADFESVHLPEIQKFIRQPSVSADGNGIKETADILMQKIRDLGGENVHLADMVKEGAWGHPQVYGEIFHGVDKPTILRPVYPDKCQ